MKSTLNSYSMHNLLNNLENDFESLTEISPEILHKKSVNAYIRKKYMKNIVNASNQIEIEPEFDLSMFNDKKSVSCNTDTFDDEYIDDYEFMDDIFSSVSSKHTDDEYSSQYNLQSALESRLQEKMVLKELMMICPNSSLISLRKQLNRQDLIKLKVYHRLTNAVKICLIK